MKQSEDNFIVFILKENTLFNIKTQNVEGFLLQNIRKVFQRHSEFFYNFPPVGIRKNPKPAKQKSNNKNHPKPKKKTIQLY